MTGLAVLIAGFTNLCARSVYHYNIIIALAWFSSVVHVSTLAILRDYLIQHPKIRNWRVCAMLALLCLLLTGKITSSLGGDGSIPSICMFRSDGEFAPVYGPKGSPRNNTILRDDTREIRSITGLIITLAFLVVSYGNRMICLYTSDPDWAISTWIMGIIARRFGPSPSFENMRDLIIGSGQRTKTERGATLRGIKDRKQFADYLISSKKKTGHHLSHS